MPTPALERFTVTCARPSRAWQTRSQPLYPVDGAAGRTPEALYGMNGVMYGAIGVGVGVGGGDVGVGVGAGTSTYTVDVTVPGETGMESTTR